MFQKLHTPNQIPFRKMSLMTRKFMNKRTNPTKNNKSYNIYENDDEPVKNDLEK